MQAIKQERRYRVDYRQEARFGKEWVPLTTITEERYRMMEDYIRKDKRLRVRRVRTYGQG